MKDGTLVRRVADFKKDALIVEVERYTGFDWLPKTGSKVSHCNLTGSMRKKNASKARSLGYKVWKSEDGA